MFQMINNNLLKMTRETAVIKYGEYSVPYKVAKKLDCFKIVWSTPYLEVKRIIKDFIDNGIENKKIYKLDVICIIEFGSIDIEFVSYGTDENNNIDIGFYCCCQNEIQTYKNGVNNQDTNGWESHGFSDMIFNIKLLENKEKFEKEMYLHMIKYAKKNGLYWSKRNF